MQTTPALLASSLVALAALALVPPATAFNQCVQPGQFCVSYYGVPPGTECHVNTYNWWPGGSLRAACNPNNHDTCAAYLNLVIRSSFACLDDAPTNGCLLGFWVMDGVPVYACP